MQMTDVIETDEAILYEFAYTSHIPGQAGKTRMGRVALDKDGCLAMRAFDGMSPADFFMLVGHIEGLDAQAKAKFHPGALEKEAKMNARLSCSQPGATISIPDTEEFLTKQQEAAESEAEFLEEQGE